MQPQSPPKTHAPAVVRMTAGDRERAGCRRPIDPSEVPYLESFGAALRELRGNVGLTQARLAELAQASASTIGKIEAGTRRTRRSTLGRIATALVGLHPDLGDADELADDLAVLAGPVLAPESEYADRISRRRERRWRKRQRQRRQSEESEGLALLADLRNQYSEEYAAYDTYGEPDWLREN